MYSKLFLGTKIKLHAKFIHTLTSNNIPNTIIHSSCVLKTSLRDKYFSEQSLTCRRLLCSAKTEQVISSQVKCERLPNILETLVMAKEVTGEEVKRNYEILHEITNDLENLPFMTKTAIGNKRAKSFVHSVAGEGLGVGPVALIADRFYAKKRRASNQLLKNEDERFRQASILCWLIEMWMKGLTVQDDMIDGNKYRNNFPSWHTRDGVGLQAIRDSHVLYQGALVLIKKYFKGQEYYLDMLEMFVEGMYKTDVGLGQMDVIRPPLNELNLLRPNSVALLKAGKTSSYAPSFPCVCVVAAMMINGATAKVPELMDSVTEISYMAGLLAAISEDYIDCFGDVGVLERSPTDIKEGKQTWLYWKALELASPSQAQLLLDSYGKYDEDCVATVKSIYKDLRIQENMDKMFQKMETDIQNRISKLPQEDVPWNSLLFFVDYYRLCRLNQRARP